MYKTRHKYNTRNPNDRAQLQCLKRAIERKRFGCFFQQRVGKSRVGVDFLGNAITQGVDKVLILCPPSASMGWVSELKMFGDTGRCVHFQYWTAGAQKLKTERPLVLLASYDLAVANGGVLKTFHPQCIVFDEVHLLKNISARHKLGRSLADKAEWVLGLTGTPFSNREYLDVYGIFRVIDPSLFGTNKKSFIVNHAAYMDEYGNPLSWLPSAEESIMTKVAEASMRVTREDVGILLDSNETVVKYPLGTRERGWYMDMRDNSVATDMSVTCAARHTWAWKTRLAQISCGILQDTESDHFTLMQWPASRHGALYELLMSAPLRGEQAIVVVKFTADIGSIEKVVHEAKRHVVTITGGLTAVERSHRIAEAKAHPNSVLIVQERTVAMGMDLSYSSSMIFYSWSDDAILHSQVKDRITGRFQDKNVEYYYIVAEKTADVQLLKNTLNHLTKAEALANWEKYREKGRDLDESVEAS